MRSYSETEPPILLLLCVWAVLAPISEYLMISPIPSSVGHVSAIWVSSFIMGVFAWVVCGMLIGDCLRRISVPHVVLIHLATALIISVALVGLGREVIEHFAIQVDWMTAVPRVNRWYLYVVTCLMMVMAPIHEP